MKNGRSGGPASRGRIKPGMYRRTGMEHGVLYARASRRALLRPEEEALECRQGVGAIIVVEVANDRLLLTRVKWNLSEF